MRSQIVTTARGVLCGSVCAATAVFWLPVLAVAILVAATRYAYVAGSGRSPRALQKGSSTTCTAASPSTSSSSHSHGLRTWHQSQPAHGLPYGRSASAPSADLPLDPGAGSASSRQQASSTTTSGQKYSCQKTGSQTTGARSAEAESINGVPGRGLRRGAEKMASRPEKGRLTTPPNTPQSVKN